MDRTINKRKYAAVKNTKDQCDECDLYFLDDDCLSCGSDCINNSYHLKLKTDKDEKEV